MDQHGRPAIDGNVLALLSALRYVEKTHDVAWWKQHEDALVHVYRAYDRFMRDGLIAQPPHSDWQDSMRRVGATFYTNLLRRPSALSRSFGVAVARRAVCKSRERDG